MPKRTAEEKLLRYRKKIKKLEKVVKPPDTAMPTPEPIQHSDEDEYHEEDDASATSPRPSSARDSVHGGTAAEGPTEETTPELDPELLTALGETLDDAPAYGPDIHAILAQRWTPLLRKGLAKDTKENLLKLYTVPKNCPFLQAPKLNAEISAAIIDMARNRDRKMESAQQQLGIGITALNRGLTTLLTDGDLTTAIKYLSDSCRILGDLHYMDTQARIKVITPGLAKSFMTVIQDNERDETLFGVKLSDKIKASKMIEKQGLQIKKPPPANKPIASTSATSSRPYQYQGNWQGASRYSSNKGGRGGGQRRGNAAPQANRKGSAPQNRNSTGQSKHQRPAPAP